MTRALSTTDSILVLVLSELGASSAARLANRVTGLRSAAAVRGRLEALARRGFVDVHVGAPTRYTARARSGEQGRIDWKRRAA